jgi:DNA polymerase-3 subunit alpha
MANIPSYIRRKHGTEAVTYLHPLLEPFLKRTYGVFVYQEDIMAAASALGGFSGPKADTLGYAVRKKKEDVLAGLKQEFITSAAGRGVAPSVIEQVFQAFEPFANYGFNKAHATCYGLIAYQTAYLKANYTVEYMTSVLNAFRNKEDKVATAIAECRRLGIAILPPDVERSQLDFEPEEGAIRFGLLAVKNVGAGAAESIVAARTRDGDFRSLQDLCERIDLRLANKRVFEALAKVGALQKFGHPAQILLALDDVLSAGSSAQRERAAGQVSLFGSAPGLALSLAPTLPHVVEAPTRERLRWERELLGVYLSDHPMNSLAPLLAPHVTAFVGDFSDDSPARDERVTIGAIVTNVRTLVTKAGAAMGILTIEDLTGSIEVVAFPKTWEATRDSWVEGEPLLVAGRPELRGETWSIICEAVLPWEEAQGLTSEGIAAHLAKNTGGTRRFTPRSVTPAGVLPRGLVPEEREGEITAPTPVPPASESSADPIEAPPGAALHIRFSPGQSVEETIRAMEVVKAELRSRPGSTKVVVHIPQAGGAQQLPMEIRSGIAWDPSFPAAIRGRVGATAVRFDILSEGESLPAA